MIDWNYYPIIDSKYQIKQFDGCRKKSRIYFDEDSQNWIMSMTSAYPHNDIEFKLSANIFAGKLPIGCKKWLAKESDCGFDSFGHQLAISVFNFPFNRSISDQFSIGQIYVSSNNTEKSAHFIIHIHMTRNVTNQLLNTFIPILILWLFGYSTLFIDMTDFGDRFMGAGTSLLVIATLFSAI